ncbi:UDP-N-acetylmuramoyl-L-alanine--D-glutamate ligase [Patescibacteria group bacterium]
MKLKPFEKFKKDYQGKKVLIMGLGLLGRGVQDAAFFAKIGAKVTVTDLKTANQLNNSLLKLKKYQIRFILGKHQKKDILATDLVLRNAAVPLNSPFLKLARKHNIPIEMDESLFVQYADNKMIGITGTRGKSTITTMIYNILKTAGYPVFLGGNISGVATLPLLEKINKKDIIVTELSSWQLQSFKKIKYSPNISVISNIYEDHLNRYKSMEGYINDKKIIFNYQTKKDFLVLNKECLKTRNLASQAKSKIIWFEKKNWPSSLKLKVKGEHNFANAAAAIKVAEILKIDKKTIFKTLQDFQGLPFRFEKIASIDGVEYINDTTSTTPIAGIVAIQSLERPVILIAGGNTKNLDMSGFAKEISLKVEKVVFLKGPETDNLIKLLKKLKANKKMSGNFSSVKKAVLKAKSLAKSGDVILFSPACRSHGIFVNEFDRGEQFNQIVRQLKKNDKK